MSDALTDKRGQSAPALSFDQANALQERAREVFMKRLVNSPIMADVPVGDVRQIVNDLASDVWAMSQGFSN